MTTECFNSFETLSCRAADVISETVRNHRGAHLCLATGASPLGAYREVARRVKERELDIGQTQLTKLDEWIGVPMSHPSTCETFLQREALGPWGVPGDRYLSFDSDSTNPAAECRRVEESLDRLPPFDLCVLGFGANGHVGLNEPSSEIQIDAHVAELAESTRHHPMLGETDLTQGMTLGLGRLFASRRIVLLVVGESKTAAWKKLLARTVSSDLPASLLHLHPNVTCLSTLSM